MGFAGFWIRFAALFIDGIVLSLSVVVLGWILNVVIGNSLDNVSVNTLSLIGQVMGFILFILYFALMESSSKQGSVGKMALGIKVVDKNGQKISFGRAILRNIVKMLSLRFWFVLVVSIVLVVIIKEKKSIHDKLVGTAVVRV